MAQFELNIYGNDDEIIKRFETDRVRWGVFMQALEMQDGLTQQSAAEQFNAITAFVKKIFPSLTDEDIENADYEDVLNTFTQLLNKANAIGGKGNNSKTKNATGAAK